MILTVALGTALLSAGSPAPAETPLAEIGARAEAGDTRAMVELGLAYRDDGLASVAADWFCRAAAQGETGGLFWCGRSLLLGFGRPSDGAAGRAMLEAAAGGGNADAALLLGAHSGAEDAIRWFALAGRLGAAEGDFRLGLLLDRRGERAAALAAYSRAADGGFAAAHNAVGVALANLGLGDPETRRRALDAFVRGARLGDQSAQLNAALELLAVDPREARRYLSLAATGRDGRIREIAERMLDRAPAADVPQRD